MDLSQDEHYLENLACFMYYDKLSNNPNINVSEEQMAEVLRIVPNAKKLAKKYFKEMADVKKLDADVFEDKIYPLVAGTLELCPTTLFQKIKLYHAMTTATPNERALLEQAFEIIQDIEAELHQHCI